jgi:serine/threonine protein kinase
MWMARADDAPRRDHIKWLIYQHIRRLGRCRGPLASLIDKELASAISAGHHREVLKIGDRLGRFELKTELGRGSHGVVFEAIDVLLNERVAIKCLHPWLSGDVTLRERFKRELVLTRRVSHPGVCRLHDLHEEDEVLFISMQHIDGKSLSQILRAALPTPDRVIQILRGVCSALSAAHARHAVERQRCQPRVSSR